MPKASIPQDGALLDSWGRRNNRKHFDKPCSDCGEIFQPRHADSQYCSRRCAWNNNGKHQQRTDSWWVDEKGYMQGRVWINGKRKALKLHRVIMEHYLGRKLKDSEDVHHENGNKLDNRPCNLRVIDHGEHSTLHNQERVYRRGYKLRLSDQERKRRSEHMSRIHSQRLAKARGEQS